MKQTVTDERYELQIRDRLALAFGVTQKGYVTVTDVPISTVTYFPSPSL